MLFLLISAVVLGVALAILCVCCAFFTLGLTLAWGLLKAYDLPVRKWLTEHWLKRARQ